MSALDRLGGTARDAFGQRVVWSDMIGNLLGPAALGLGWRAWWLRTRSARMPRAVAEGAAL